MSGGARVFGGAADAEALGVLSAADLAELVAVRRALHRHPEVSGQEVGTAARVAAALAASGPARIVTQLGGHGVAAVWDGPDPGPTVMLRAELDALPIAEVSEVAHRSTVPGVGHLCGHDGHMAILLGVARLIARRPPARGRVVLMFQPAEEDGSGAAAVLGDPRFASIRADWAFALHNMPGHPLGHAMIAPGPANCASEGLRVRLVGRSAHASAPEDGVSPALALAELMASALAAGPGGTLGPDFRLVSLCHVRMGAPAFGSTPGEGELWLTLRTLHDAGMAALRDEVMALAARAAEAHGLSVAVDHHDRFAACANDPDATAALRQALDGLGIGHDRAGWPMRASEDFGRFGHAARAAMLLLGAGEGAARLHTPDYDFPDALIPRGVAIFDRLWRDLLGSRDVAGTVSP